jgi:hypothetical protein
MEPSPAHRRPYRRTELIPFYSSIAIMETSPAHRLYYPVRRSLAIFLTAEEKIQAANPDYSRKTV